MGGFLKDLFGGGPPGGGEIEDIAKREHERKETEEERRRKAEEERRRRVSAAKKKRLGELEAAEIELKGELTESTREVGTAIDRELEGLVSDVGFQAGEARSITGEQAAARSLGRSTFATEELGEVSRRELEQKSLARGEAERRRRAVAQTTSGVLSSIADRREKIRLQIEAANEVAAAQAVSLFDINRIQSDFQTQINSLEIAGANKRQLIGTLGSLLGDVTQIAVRES